VKRKDKGKLNPRELVRLFAWAHGWYETPDKPGGPVEMTTGQYIAVNARLPFLRAVFQHCPTSLGELVTRLRMTPEPSDYTERLEYFQRQQDIVRDWASPFGLREAGWFTSMLAVWGHSFLLRRPSRSLTEMR